MAVVLLRSGVRRLVPHGSSPMIQAEAVTAAILQNHARAPSARASSLPYHPRVDLTDIHLGGLTSIGTIGTPVDDGSPISHDTISGGSYHPHPHPQVETTSRRPVAASDAVLTASSRPPPPYGAQVDGSSISLLACASRDTRSAIPRALLAATAGGSSTSFRVASACSPSRSSTSYHPQVHIRSQITVGILDCISGGSAASLSYQSQCKPYAGASCRSYSSLTSRFAPASRAEEIAIGCARQVRQLSADAPQNGRPDLSLDAHGDAKAEVSDLSPSPGTQNPEICKCDAVLDGIKKIETKVGEVSSKVDKIDEKLDENIKESVNVKKEVELIRSKGEGSGDWTSFKIRGKTINWLSVASALLSIFK